MTADLPINQRWLVEPHRLRDSFAKAAPFPHLVLDDFLLPDLADGLLADFPDLDRMPKSRDYVFGDKRELANIERAGPAGARWQSMITSPEFARWLQAATGYEVFVDVDHYGGGFHQSGNGGFLDLHLDFNLHPLHQDWLRTLNILVYLTPGWDASWGGELLLKSAPEGQATSVIPSHNRGVVMLTGDSTYHGVRPLRLPDGERRRSVATYAYRHSDDVVVSRTTTWAPENAGAFKRVLARHYQSLVRTRSRFIGSRTAKHR